MIRSAHRNFGLLLILLLFFFTYSDAAKRGRQHQRELDEPVGFIPDGEAETASRASGHAEPTARGGRLQRARRREDDKPETTTAEKPNTPLNDNLRLKWARGKLSSLDLQSIAYDARSQGAHGLDALSGAGSSGKHAQNLFRDLVHIFGRPAGAPELDWILIPTKGNRRGPSSCVLAAPFVFFFCAASIRSPRHLAKAHHWYRWRLEGILEFDTTLGLCQKPSPSPALPLGYNCTLGYARRWWWFKQS